MANRKFTGDSASVVEIRWFEFGFLEL